jgi:hypothetical protein
MAREELANGLLHTRRGIQDGDNNRTMDGELCLILYPKELEDEILELLEVEQVPGYTAMPKMVGCGRRIRHFDNPVWPGASGAVFSVVTHNQAAALALTVRRYSDRLAARSHGFYGVNFFALPCRQLI